VVPGIGQEGIEHEGVVASDGRVGEDAIVQARRPARGLPVVEGGLEARAHGEFIDLPAVQTRAPAADPSLHGHRTVNLESASAVGVDPLQRTRPLRTVL